MADNTQLPIPSTSGDVIAADDIAGVKFQRVKLIHGADGVNDGDVSSANPLPMIGTVTDGTTPSDSRILLVGGVTSAGVAQAFETNGSGHLNVSDGGGSITVDATSLPLPTGAATEATLSALNNKLLTSTAMPDQNATALPVRQAPQKYWDASFPQVGSGILSPRFTQIGATGTGMAVSQSAGNLVITTGTTANSEVTLRSTQSFTGALTLHQLTTLSQRIVNNNFFVELVDVIGDGLAYNIVNTTTVDVTLTAHGYTAANVGQRMDIGVITGAAGVPQEAVIASIPNANTIRFTVAGWPATGTGTCSLTGWNKVELLYTGATATTLNFNTRRQGWQNTAVAATINTTASGHITATNVCNGVAALSDQVNTSAGVYANRATWRTNIPEPEVVMFLQLRARNGTVAPASTTTWTLGFTRVEDYIPTQVDIVGTKVQNTSNSFPVNVIGTVPVSGTVTSNIGTGTLAAVTTVSAVTSANLGVPTIVADVASAALTTTTTTAAFTPTFGTTYIVNIPVTAVSGTNQTLDVTVQESDDTGTNWYNVYHFDRITAVGMYRSPPLTLRGNLIRYVQTVGGTSPSFTRAINRLQSSYNEPLRVQFIDRTINLNSAFSVSPSFYVGGCVEYNLLVALTGAQTTAATVSLQYSIDNVNFYTSQSSVSTLGSATVQAKPTNEQGLFVRAITQAAGSGITLNYIAIIGRGA